MGFVMLGIATLTEIGINAAIFGMVAHGIITGMLFFCVGSIYDRYHTREIAEIGGGMSEQMPKLGGVFAFVAIASLGLPGPGRVLGRGHGAAVVLQPDTALGLSTSLFRGFMIAGRDRDDPHRRLLPVDAPAREHGHAAGEVEGAHVPRHRWPSSGWRGCRCWSGSWSSACSRA